MRIPFLAALLFSTFFSHPDDNRFGSDRPFRFTPFSVPFPQTLHTQVMGLNDLGVLVGTYQDATGNHAFLRQNDNYSNIDVTLTGANETTPYAINLEGNIVGRYQLSGRYHGFIRKKDRITTVDYPDTNNFGTVLTGINLEGTAIGIYSNLTGTDGFIYSRNHFTLIAVPGASITYISAINDLGTVVGYYAGNGDLGHPFLYRSGRYTPFVLPAPNVFAAYPTAINDLGQIAGYFSDNTGTHGFVLDLSQHLTVIDVPPAVNQNSITILRGLNNLNQVVGSYGFPSVSFTGTLTQPWF